MAERRVWGACALLSGLACIDPEEALQQTTEPARPVVRDSGPAPVPAVDLMRNGGYESGTAGWEVVGNGLLELSSEVFHQGVYSAMLTGRAAPGDGLAQRLADRLTPSKRYRVRVYVAVGGLALADAAEGAYEAFLSLGHSCGLPAFDRIDERRVTADGWTALSGEFSAPPCPDPNATLSIDGPAAGVDLYVDTWSLVDAAATQLP